MKDSFLHAVTSAVSRGNALEMASPARVSGAEGRRTGRGTGNALEFAEYRDYRAGDDLRRLDWGVYARTGELMVRLFSEEVDPRCDLVVDESASMSADPGKAESALGLAALLACAAANSGFSLNVWHAGNTFAREPFPYDPLHWTPSDFDSKLSPAASIQSFAGRFHARGLRILVSDLLWEGDPSAFLGRLSDGAKRTAAVQILSKCDSVPDFSGVTALADSESREEREVELDSAALERYRERFARHRELWENACTRCGVQLVRLETERLFPVWELDELFRCGVLR